MPIILVTVILSSVTKSVTKWCFSHGFLWNRGHIYILWLLVTPLIDCDYIGTYSHKFHIARDQIHRGLF